MNKRSRFLTASLILSFCAVLGLLPMVWFTSEATGQGTFTVTKVTDEDGTCDDDCTLREAINAANAAAGVNIITFSLPPSATITLGGVQLPAITDTLTIDGGTSANLTISGANRSRVFEIGSATEVHLTSLTIADGNALFGGGIINLGGALTVRSSIFSGNSAGVTGNGGGIANTGGPLTVRNSSFNGNSAGVNGGGISNFENGTVTVSNSTFSGNRSTVQGGGIGKVGGTMTVSNSTFSDNSASQSGGGIHNLGGTLTVRSSTFNGNSAGIGSGGGINNENGTLHLLNTIIANSPSGGDCASFGPMNGTNINNLIEDSSCDATFSGDPLLDSLQDNGGPTKTHALLDDSPAIDAGEDSACTIADQRGYFRLSVCDIGAFEFGGVRPEYTYLPVILGS